jgi:ribosome biogenesis GTPase
VKQLGWDDQWEVARAGLEGTPVRIVAEHRGAYHAIGDELQPAWVELRGKAFHDAQDKRALPTVGDWVLVDRWPEALAANGAGVVRHVLPRRSFLVRRAAGEAVAPQPLAANVDVGIVMTSANADLVLPRLDRYLGLLRDGGIEPIIAVSKIDLAGEAATRVAEAAEVGAQAIAVSSVNGAGLAEVRALVGPARRACCSAARVSASRRCSTR